MTIELPGLFDLQVNGFAGVDFNAAGLTADRVSEALDRMRATGVTLKGAQTLSGRNEVLVNYAAEAIAAPNADFIGRRGRRRWLP
jgi:N-acetylglucosamine-6-phosphate deacetylase